MPTGLGDDVEESLYFRYDHHIAGIGERENFVLFLRWYDQIFDSEKRKTTSLEAFALNYLLFPLVYEPVICQRLPPSAHSLANGSIAKVEHIKNFK